MKYGKIENGIIVQTQPHEEDGFIEIPDKASCGMLRGEDGTFSAPPRPAKTAEELKDDEKIFGKLYDGYQIPLTKIDADGMLQVEAALLRYGQTATNIKFSNGVTMPMTAADFPIFAAWFAAERNSFFE